ncbi:LysE family transporter [Desulfosporosinus sp. PR]|uniref:LysE family translocator n=1 Tax=Candidatus Desulfosporosinus nitrosoreducens TaxID=3401928 RepID=UPI0027FAECF1|nr:LysE family transporter [Desulfosporosinus sp. PR]MDQ7094025.1 LysE family transporter [Desulfosporosinus sp. PR]
MILTRRKVNMIFKGFKFGILLQLAIGPVCLFIFKIGGNKGFIGAEIGVSGVTLADAFYIVLAISGIASCVERERVKNIFKIMGALIVAIFGLQAVIGVFGLKILPNINLFNEMNFGSLFLESIVITASNPLTILFWAGVFSTKIVEEGLQRREIYLFGFGSVLSTAFFLTIIAAIGSVTRYFLPMEIISLLNLVVGIVLIGFALKIIAKKR